MMATVFRVELTQEELRALKAWLSAVRFQGTRKEIDMFMRIYDSVAGKIDSALAETESARGSRKMGEVPAGT